MERTRRRRGTRREGKEREGGEKMRMRWKNDGKAKGE
jgi:hypothetical protein